MTQTAICVRKRIIYHGLKVERGHTLIVPVHVADFLVGTRKARPVSEGLDGLQFGIAMGVTGQR